MAYKFNPFTGKLDIAGTSGGGGTVTSIVAGTGLNGGTITTSGTISVKYGTTAGTAAQGNDTRLSDSRIPTAHASTHASAGSDPVTVTLTSQVTGTLPVANGGTGRIVGNYSIYANEIHVGKDGNDTTGDGTLINPVLTITKALTLVGSGRNTVIVHPGGYTENPTVTSTNTTITTSELTGANTFLTGTLTLSAAARVSGLKMSDLTITGSGNTYISNCTVDTRVIKSGSNYVEIINSELQCTSGVQITGAGTVSIVGNKCWSVAVSNAAASVLIKDCFQVITPSVTAGSLQFDGCAIFAVAPTTNAITTSVGTNITLANSFVLNSAGTSVERVSLLGSYSILNLVYDKANSTLTGTNLNAIDYFSVINAETLTSGKIGVNTTPDATVGLSVDSTGIKFSNGSIQTTALGGGGTPADVQIFATPGAFTWTKPAGAKSVNITVISGGSGGGSGTMSAAASPASGGGGGGGGARTIVTLQASLLAASENGIVGAGGAGGASVTSAGFGLDGTNGIASYFGLWAYANTGTRGGGGTAFGGTAGSSAGRATYSGGTGGSGGTTSSGVSSAINTVAGTGGGGGAGTNGLVASTGGNGALSFCYNGSSNFLITAGANGPSVPSNTPLNGSGGGGGSSSITAPAMAGGNGGNYGAGGGGGGGGSGFASGKGGNGSQGIVVVTTYF
jgi:hypothetical protein